MFTLIRKLYRTRLLTVLGLLRLLQAVLTTGINLMALLRLAAQLHPHRIAAIDEREQLTYPELWQQAESLAKALHRDHGIHSRQKVAIACRNHTAAVKSIFAVSRLGAHVFLLNPEMSKDQILALEERLKFDFYIYDEHVGQDRTTVGDCVSDRAHSWSARAVCTGGDAGACGITGGAGRVCGDRTDDRATRRRFVR